MGPRRRDAVGTATCVRHAPLDWRTNASLIGEPTQAPTIPANAKVSEVAPQHRGQAAMLVAERPMAVFPAPGSNCSHRAGKPVFGGHLPNHVLTIPRPPPDMS